MSATQARLYQNIPRGVSYYLEQFGGEVRCEIMRKLSEDGVNMQEGKLVRYKSFVSLNECNTGQIVFLNQNIPRQVSYYLEQFRAELRCEFMGVNTNPHSKLITMRKYSKSRQDR